LTELSHLKLSEFLSKTKPTACPCVWLIHGEEMLVESACDSIGRHLLGEEATSVSWDMVDGFAQNVPDLLERLNTFALLSDTKVVVFKDAKLFETRGGQAQLVDQVREAWQSDELPKAAKAFLSLCGRLGIEPGRALGEQERHPELDTLVKALGNAAVDQLIGYCDTHGWKASATLDHADHLQRAIEKGFPAGHYLLVTVTSKVPKNLKFYKALNAHGVIVDCSVPLGERRPDKEAQEAVLRQTLEIILQKSGKHLAPGTFGMLCELTGFDLRTFSQNLEKLVDYVGPRQEISAADIHALLRRTKSDPLFQLTGAVADRNVKQALFFCHSLLNSNWHALQLLAALANQIRKLLVAKDFAGSQFGGEWNAGVSYQQFQRQVLSAVQAYDEYIESQLSPWPAANKKPKSTAGKAGSSDLRLAPSPKNPYPIYQTLIKSENFTRNELIAAIGCLSQADVRMKSTGQDPTLVIKKVIVDICSRAA
jgi:DNA polymerase-3 subunit delta